MKEVWKNRKKKYENLDLDLKYIINNDKEGYFNKIKKSLDKIFLNEKKLNLF